MTAKKRRRTSAGKSNARPKYPSAPSTAKNDADQKPQVPEGDFEFALRAIGAWAVAMLTIGSIVMGYHGIVAGAELLFSGLLALIFDLWLWNRYRRKRSVAPFKIALAAFVLSNVALVLIAAPNAWTAIFPPTWRVVTSTSMSVLYTEEPGHSGSLNLYTVENTDSHAPYELYSVNLAVELELVNLLPEPRSLTGYVIETEGSPFVWHKMCFVNSLAGKLVFSGKTLASGFVLKLDPLDNKLKKVVPPKATVVGWSEWQCPGFDCTNSRKRLVLRDANGTSEILPLDLIHSQRPDRFMAGGKMGMGGSIDFTGHPLGIFSGMLCSGQMLPYPYSDLE